MSCKDYALLKSWLKSQSNISVFFTIHDYYQVIKLLWKGKRLTSGMAEAPLYTSEIDTYHNFECSWLEFSLYWIILPVSQVTSYCCWIQRNKVQLGVKTMTAKFACSFRNQMQEIVFGTLPHVLHHLLFLCFNRHWTGALLLSRKMLWKCWPAMGWHTPWWSSSRVPWVTSKM